MTEVPPREPAAPPKVLRRSGEGRILMGVCAGLGRHTGIDPVVFRVAFAVLLLGSGVGLFLYLAAFLLMKEPNGKPGIIEQWTRRDFDADAVMALLTAVLAFGLAINLATVWLDTGTLVVGVLLAVSLLAAHSSGVDLLGLARSMPERLGRRRAAEQAAPSYTSQEPAPPVRPAPAPTPSAASRPAAEETVTPAPEAAQAEGAPRADEAEWPSETTARLRGPGETHVNDAAAARETAAPADETAAYGSEAPAPADEAGRTRAHEAAAGAGEVVEGRGEDDSVTAQHAAPTYQPTAYRPQPKTAVDYTGYGEPFAPKGPYRPLDPARRAGGQSPYDPTLYGRPVPGPERRPRPKSFIGVITILLAIIIGGIVVAVQARSAAGVSPTIVGGAMLITIGAGLLVAAWWGRGAGLVAAGTTVALIVGLGLMLGGLPRNIGPSEWAPTTLAEVSALYDVGVGDGRLDLSELELAPGATATVNATFSLGELEVIVPPTVRLEVHATNKVGDIKVDQSIRGGVDIRLDKVVEPETKPDGKVSTIVLNLRGGLGDMEVRRAA
ncbi:PspC domain-containing protein [Nonomuraea basaltis]|uniref:PspC domain-containing protein n=1 Tax=Nonomuraea basaltis TaxID=2495887 RepID=UPI001486E1D9|nr:PspC domain-containing protein [Nonomuraea basaltis]